MHSGLLGQSQTSKPSKTLDTKMEERQLWGIPFDHGIKSLMVTDSVLQINGASQPHSLEEKFDRCTLLYLPVLKNSKAVYPA